MFSKKTKNGIYCSRFFVVFVALALVFSFGIHSIQVEHSHPGHTHVGEEVAKDVTDAAFSLYEYVHGYEQKMLLAIVLSILSLGFLVMPRFLYKRAVYTTHDFLYLSFFVLKLERCNCLFEKIHNLFLCLFRIGVLNPKLY